MQTIRNIPLRFGDPIISIAQNHSCAAYGTAYGKVELLNLQTNELTLISDISEEFIPSLCLSPENTLVYAVGDFYLNQATHPYGSTDQKTQYYSRIHTVEDCSNSIIFVLNETSCLIPTNGGDIYILNIKDQSCKVFNRLPDSSIPIDFALKEILIEQFIVSGKRQFSYFYYESGITEVIMMVDRNTHMSFVKICKDGLTFIQNYCEVCFYCFQSESVEVAYKSIEEIICYGKCEIDDDIWVAFADISGKIVVFKNWEVSSSGEISYLGNTVRDFEKGYPYVLSIYPPYLSISSDNFMHVIKF